jgi:hypothetical protein
VSEPELSFSAEGAVEGDALLVEAFVVEAFVVEAFVEARLVVVFFAAAVGFSAGFSGTLTGGFVDCGRPW